MLMERQDLEFDSQVNLAHINSVRHGKDAGRKVENARDAGCDKPIGNALRGVGGGRYHRDVDVVLSDHLIKIVNVTH
jgi:hypothetical protein